MKIRSRAPLRLGLAGGGTDLESYSNVYGGAVLNATIKMYAYCTIEPTNNGRISIVAYDNNNSLDIESTPEIKIEGEELILHKGVYNRIVKDFNGGKPLSFNMSTSNDAPVGSGLGTSSTMVVAILEAFNNWLKLGLSQYDMAMLAYSIEREDLLLKGGKQDQFSAVYGGFNLMEFNKDGSTTIAPLNLDGFTLNELESSLILFYNGRSRSSAKIISEQISNAKQKKIKTITAMHSLKKCAYKMKETLEKGKVSGFARILKQTWAEKKKTSSIISNNELEIIIKFAMANGAKGLKISGAGGGGFLMLYCNPHDRQRLTDAMKTLHGQIFPVYFSSKGVESWTVVENED